MGDTWGVICGGRGRGTLSRCIGCGKSSELLCDGPGVAGRKTCDAPVCVACARTIGRDRHLCPGCDVPVTARAAAGPRHDEIEAMFSGPVRLVSVTTKNHPDNSGRKWLPAYRIHVHQLGASVVHKLAVHYGRKLEKQPWMVLDGMMTGQVPPIIGAELLEVIGS